MSEDAFRPSAAMPIPDQKYLRPSHGPATAQSQINFSQLCSSGDLRQVTGIVDIQTVNAELLNQGLAAAVRNKELEVAAFLLTKGARIDSSISLAAAMSKSVEVFDILYEHGWDVNTPILHGKSVLLVCLDDDVLVEWLLRHSARIGSARPDEASAASDLSEPASAYLNAAASSSSTAVLDMLLQHGATLEGSIALHAAAGAGANGERIPMMARLIEIGFDINASEEDFKGNQSIGTPLHYAVLAKSVEKVEFLLANGAALPGLQSQAGETPLDMARRMGLQDIVQTLQRYL